MRGMRIAAIVAVALLLAAGKCDDQEPESDSRSLLSPQQRESVQTAAAEGEDRVTNVAALVEAGYTAVSLRVKGDLAYVVFKPCGDKSLEDCESDVQPNDDRSLAYLALAQPPADDQSLVFGEAFQVLIAATYHDQAIVCEPTSIVAINPDGFGALKDAFSDLTYDEQGHTKTVDGSEWHCALS